VVTAVASLEIALSYEVIIGSIALRRTSNALATLLPAALGLALGAGQGSMLAKALIPASRLPARIATIVVLLATPTLCALLAIVNQLLASWFGTLACTSVLGAILVWLPYRPIRQRLVAFLSGTASADAADAKGDDHPVPRALIDLHALRFPSNASPVVEAIGYRKWAVTAWLTLTVIFAVCFVSFDTSLAMVTGALDERRDQLREAFQKGNEGNGWSTLFWLVAPGLQMFFNLVAKTYLSQVFYTDIAVEAVASLWKADEADDEAVRKDRSHQFDEVCRTMDARATAEYQGTDAEIRVSAVHEATRRRLRASGGEDLQVV